MVIKFENVGYPNKMASVTKGATPTETAPNELAKIVVPSKPVTIISFKLNENDAKDPYAEQKLKRILQTLGNAKLWTPTGYTGIRCHNKFELFAEEGGQTDLKSALDALAKLKLEVEYDEDGRLIASRPTGVSLDRLYKRVKEWEDSKELPGWVEVSPASDTGSWELFP
ncbi:unnamed protein product [Clonostachys rosea]|uniref:Uncharacterized protein n=1 Tax=Bionectria ochroleuca TaxID=29856 RepID=A0ABY6TY19_BIOOC|nr:unnamed protein product [Clonostachys rosea]